MSLGRIERIEPICAKRRKGLKRQKDPEDHRLRIALLVDSLSSFKLERTAIKTLWIGCKKEASLRSNSHNKASLVLQNWNSYCLQMRIRSFIHGYHWNVQQ